MLHPVNLPDCLEHLWFIVWLQEQLLELACSQDATDASILNQHFDTMTLVWLQRHRQKLIDPLGEFVNHPDQAEKLAILDAFRHDITYHDHLEDARFIFCLLPESQMPSSLAVSVGQWLQNFYDKVMQGVPAAVVDYSEDINSQLIYEGFRSINTETRVCPACDATWMEPTSTGILGSLDHFLPRSKYPALSVHPFNLMLVCETCNEDIKKSKDPLADNQLRTLADAFVYCPTCHPSRPARDTLSVQIGTTTSYRWQLQCLRATAVQISLFPDIYDLPGRWQARCDELDRRVRSRIRNRLSSTQVLRGTITRNSFAALLGDVEQSMRREWGETEYLYPATWWLRWLQQNKLEDLMRDLG